MKYLSWIAIVIAAIVAINELSYINSTSLAWVIIGLAVSIILVAAEQLSKKA